MSTSTSKIEYLAAEIKKHKDIYYNKSGDNVSKLSDTAFDALEEELKALAPDHEILRTVGAETSSEEWLKARHEIPMGSLDKRKTPEQMNVWITETFKPHNTVFVTQKLDGLSIEVIYREGKLTQAITRGNGIEGDDITANVVRMRGVKQTLPIAFTGSLRGEIILKKSLFNSNPFFAEYANARNAASGISKRLDGVGCEYLTIFFYQAIGEKFLCDSETEQFYFLAHELGLEVPRHHAFSNNSILSYTKRVNELWKFYQDGERDKTDWEIDGLVVRVNELADQKALGDIHLKPKGAMAFKFKEESANSIVTAIQLQVGNTGRITPVVEVEPVHLMGVDVNRASLYNCAYVRQLGIDVGAKVVIVRANDVIPRCEAILEPTGTVFQPPTKCPVCNGRVEMIGENLQCMEIDTCPAQVVGKLKNWISTLNVLEWGDKLLERLVATGIATNVADLYKLSIDDLSKLERMGKVSATKCHNILWQHNPIGLDLFLGGLSIPMIGTSTIQLLIESGLDTLIAIRNASCETFAAIKGMGPVRSQSLFDGLKQNSTTIDNLLKVGLKIQESDVAGNEPAVSNKLEGLTLCITGSTKVKRSDLIQIINDNGGAFVGSVNKKCTHLIISEENLMSSKAQNARKLGIKIFSEDDFFALIE